MSSPVHVTIQSVRLSWRIAGSDGSKSTIGLKDGGGFGTAKNSTPAQIGQKAQPAAVGRSCEAAEAINGNEGAGSGPPVQPGGVSFCLCPDRVFGRAFGARA